MKFPKYNVGTDVTFRDKYNDTHKGKIVECERVFKVIEGDGHFKSDGLVTLESTISSIGLPYEFDGNILKVTFPEKQHGNIRVQGYTQESHFYGYCYTIEAEMKEMIGGKVRMVVGENQIIRLES